MAYEYFESLPGEARTRYEAKIAAIGFEIEFCPYKIPASSWVQDPTQWPDLQYGDLYSYLIESPGIFTRAAMKNYRGLEAHNYFVSGWVQTVHHFLTPTGNFVLKADVKPSQRMNDEPHHPLVALHKDGTVLAGHCTCMAGLGESCSHVGALLFKVEAAVRLGYTKLACTSKPCEWNACFVKKVQPCPISGIDFYKEEAKAKCRATHERKYQRKEQNTPSPEEQDTLLTALGACTHKSVGLSSFINYSGRYKPKPVLVDTTTLPFPLRSLYSEEYSQLSKKELEEKCSAIKDEITITEAQISYLDSATAAQADSLLWHEQRTGRVTASKTHALLHTDVLKPAPSLVKGICSGEVKVLNTPAIKWGRDHEHVALQCYSDALRGNHTNFLVSKCGLRLCQEMPFMGASADSLVSCDWCPGQGVVEVKCPYTFRDVPLDQYKGRKDCPLDENNILKNSHPCYAQVQMQIHEYAADYADFVLWSPESCVVTRVMPDRAFIHHLVQTVQHFWQSAVLPELLTRKLERECYRAPCDTDSTKIYCICQEENDDAQIGCDNDQCPVKWYHYKCAGIKRPPKGSWYCKTCRRNKKNKWL